MQKALIHIGAGELQVDTILWAREIGLKVIATDLNNSAIGLSYADEYYCVSGSDEDGLCDLVKHLSNQYNIVGAYGSSDFCLKAVAKIHKLLGLKGCSYESVNLALDKYGSKRIWLKNNIKTPFAHKLSKFDLDNNLPRFDKVIIKPKNSCGSQGIKSIKNNVGIQEAIDSAFHYSDEVLVEEYIDGKHYDTIGIIWGKKFIPLGIGNRYFSSEPYCFPLWGHSPADLCEHEQNQAYDLTKDAALSLGLNYTPVKADLIYSKGIFYIVEIAPRFHGDVFSSKMIPMSCGIKPAKVLFNLMCGHFTESILECRKKIIWKAVFPCSRQFNKEWLDDLFYKEIFIDGRKKIKTQHQDNTSLLGFLWFEVPEKKKIMEYYQYINNNMKNYLL